MKSNQPRWTEVCAKQLTAIAAMIVVLASSASAGTITYTGPFSDIGGGGSTIYSTVVESSLDVPPAKFGAPTAVVDSLDFDPISFKAEALSGGADFIDVGLSFDADTIAGMGVTSLIIEETLDYSFTGGTASTLVRAAIGGVRLTILEIDGVPVASIEVDVPNSLIERNAMDHSLTGTFMNSVLVDLVPFLPSGSVATKFEVVLNDSLAANAEAGFDAIIEKKDFVIRPGVDPDPNNNIPEPGTLGLITLASMMGGMMAIRKRLG